MLVQRILLALAALAAGGWLAVSLVGQSALERATDVSKDTKASPAAVKRAIQDAERAADLRPADNEPDLVRGQLLVRNQQRDEGLKLLEAVARREPDNVRAWFYIAVLTVDTDRPRSRNAVARAQKLDPLGAPRTP